MNSPTETEILPLSPPSLEGITLGPNAFTGTAAKEHRAPRPPLFWAVEVSDGAILQVMDGVQLAINGGRVCVKRSTKEPIANCNIMAVGEFRPGGPKGPSYTGPITPSMAQIISKWWKP